MIFCCVGLFVCVRVCVHVCVLESQIESLKGVGDCCPSHAGGTDLGVCNCFLKLFLLHRQGVCGFNLASRFHHSYKFI